MTNGDLDLMPPPVRLAEVAELLARGLQRLFLAECKARRQSRNSQDHLAVLPAAEAPCRADALSPKSQEPAA